jgi:hypothetical protein
MGVCFRSYRARRVLCDDRVRGAILVPAALQRGLCLEASFFYFMSGEVVARKRP